jgi:hypothetical protein
MKAQCTVVALALVCVALAEPVQASVVLLDEYWLPEITQTDVAVTEIDTEQTGDPTQAVAGYYSALLENDVGAPSARFRGAANIPYGALPPGETEARLWYRTDAWAGVLELDVFVHSPQAGRPVRALQAVLDGGGPGGRLIADDRWHQAFGLLLAGDEYDQLMQDIHPRACYVWLRANEGWDIAHRTYIDRVEAIVLDENGGEKIAPRPASRIRPSPGRQTDGPGWVWWEGEDALDYTGPPTDVFVPRTADAQSLLSGGAWVNKSRKTDLEPLHYEITVAENGTHALWARGYWKMGSFRWRWDEGDWHTASPDVNTSHWAMLQVSWLPVGWFCLGECELASGKHNLTVETLEAPRGLGFDCWVLARSAFARPAEPVAEQEPAQ